MQRFTCECGNVLFFGNSQCLKCSSDVGYDPGASRMVRLKDHPGLVLCANGVTHGVCNWLTDNDGSPAPLCVACRTNRTIPDLSFPQNVMLWGRVEVAKRRLFYTLLRLGMTLPSKVEDPAGGLAFDILSTAADPDVTMGHLDGVITVTLEEADDAYRHENRQRLGENSRTLLGHFRHEIAHYFWHRRLEQLPPGSPERQAVREVFGNDGRDYAEALAAYYKSGPPAGWEHRFISAYASSHPWEDWAETWAHYLQAIDAVETCESLGMKAQYITLPLATLPAEPADVPSTLDAEQSADAEFANLLQRWTGLSTVLNEIALSVGEAPLYPFVITVPVARKLRLAHRLAVAWGREAAGTA